MDLTFSTKSEYRGKRSNPVYALWQWMLAHRLDVILMTGVGLAGLWIGLWASAIILDDAMITFRVAENLAHGEGFVYNSGERVQVTTTPLYAMVLAAGVWIFGSATRAALVLNIALAALSPVLAYDLGRRLAGRITGLGGAALLMLAPLLVQAFSMESYLYVALTLATMDAYVAGYDLPAGTAAGLTALVRGDGVFLGACLLTYDLLMQRRLRWRLIGPSVLIPAAWYLFALLYYGSPFPATLGAKVAQGEFNWLGLRFLDGLAFYWDRWIRVQDYDTFYLFPVLVIIALVWIIWRERLWLPLVARDALYVLVFVGLSVPTAEWYYAPLMPGIALLSARGVHLVAAGTAWLLARLIATVFGRPGKSQLVRPAVSTATALFLLLILLVTLYPVTRNIIARSPDWKARVYPDAARWIAANTDKSANLATIDIGHIGYWSEKPIIDIVGLAQPDVSPHIARGDFGYAIRRYQPDLVLIGYSWLPEIQRAAWFQTAYGPRRYFIFEAIDEPLLLLSRREGVKVQPEINRAMEIQPLDIDFNRQITLTGYQLNRPLLSGSNLVLTLFWQAKAPIDQEFTVFVQLVGENNRILAQGDGKPQQGYYGTSYWQPGEEIIDTHLVPVTASIPSGSYDILLGLYNVDTGYRLQILDGAGVFQSDHVRLSPVYVQVN